MAKNEPTTKYFKIPEPLPQGWSFMMTAEYIIDRIPQFQTTAGARKGAKLLDAVEKALSAKPPVVEWAGETWSIVAQFIESENFRLPTNYLMRGGIPTDQLVPMKAYLPHIDAILEAADEAPKSVEEESLAEASRAAQVS